MHVLICGLVTVLPYRFQHEKDLVGEGGGGGGKNRGGGGGRGRAFKFTFLMG